MYSQLTVLGTPAEEGGGGKIDLIGSGAFADVDVAMMAHPSQTNLQKPTYLAMTEYVSLHTCIHSYYIYIYYISQENICT